MFSVQLLAVTPGSQAVAGFAQSALGADKPCRFSPMTACACQINRAAITCRMLVVHSIPCCGLCGMTQGTAGDLGRPGLITQFAEGNHLGAVNGLTGAAVAFSTGRGHGFWINTVGDQHLGKLFNGIIYST